MQFSGFFKSRRVILTGAVLAVLWTACVSARFHPIWFDERHWPTSAPRRARRLTCSMAGSPLYYILLRGWGELPASRYLHSDIFRPLFWYTGDSLGPIRSLAVYWVAGWAVAVTSSLSLLHSHLLFAGGAHLLADHSYDAGLDVLPSCAGSTREPGWALQCVAWQI